MSIQNRKITRISFCVLLMSVLLACNKIDENKLNDVAPESSSNAIAEATLSSKTGLSTQPNILWLVVEDMSPILSAYGDNTIETPAISQLAKQGVTYTNVYSTSGVCSPSRAALALGMYPSSIGANHMRTSSFTEVTGLPKYEAVPPVEAKMLSQLMRENGYYTTNNLKTDYQFTAPKAAWDESGPYAHWRDRPNGKPFFAVVNFTTTHESGLFEPYGVRLIESRHYFSDDREKIRKLPQHHSVKTTPAQTPTHVSPDTEFPIPPYLPDTPLVRRDMWKMYNNLAETDKQIAAVLKQLKDDGLYDSTIIVFYSDHGGPLPRQKRLIYDSGLKVPMIIRYPNTINANTKDDQLISFIDFAPTTLMLAGVDTPNYMHGRNFIDNDAAKNTRKERQYIHAAADRFDGFTDTIRAVKNKRYKYIRNYRPEQGYYLPVEYREKIPTMQELLRLRDAGELNKFQLQWFRESKEVEELFDTQNDPHELNNLAGDKKYSAILAELRAENDRWLDEINDEPELLERQLIDRIWQGNAIKPSTKKPSMTFNEGLVSFSSETPGATISFQEVIDGDERVSWQLYQGTFKADRNAKFKVVAHRIGFAESAIIDIELNN
jgi:arylsulfatase A-like enzyme